MGPVSCVQMVPKSPANASGRLWGTHCGVVAARAPRVLPPVHSDPALYAAVHPLPTRLACCLPSLQESKERSDPSTKVACTIGDVSRDVETLCALLEAGMSVSAAAQRQWHQR